VDRVPAEPGRGPRPDTNRYWRALDVVAFSPAGAAVDSLGSNPLTADITKLTFVNAGLVDAVVTAGFLLNL
jgi:hypothetical protein